MQQSLINSSGTRKKVRKNLIHLLAKYAGQSVNPPLHKCVGFWQYFHNWTGKLLCLGSHGILYIAGKKLQTRRDSKMIQPEQCSSKVSFDVRLKGLNSELLRLLHLTFFSVILIGRRVCLCSSCIINYGPTTKS